MSPNRPYAKLARRPKIDNSHSSGTRACTGSFEPRRPALPLTEAPERIGEIHLGCGPIERYAHAGIFLQGFAIGGAGPSRSPARRALRAYCRDSSGSWPKRAERAGIFLQRRAIGGKGLLEAARPALSSVRRIAVDRGTNPVDGIVLDDNGPALSSNYACNRQSRLASRQPRRRDGYRPLQDQGRGIGCTKSSSGGSR